MAVVISQLPLDTGFVPASDREMLALQKIVEAKYPNLAATATEFRSAFVALGRCWFRSPGLAKRYAFEFVTDANAWLSEHRMDTIAGHGFMAAVVVHSDILFMFGDKANGVPIGVGLSPYSGRKCSNAWRDVLAGRPLREPIIPVAERQRLAGQGAPRPTTYQEGASGQMRELRESWRG